MVRVWLRAVFGGGFCSLFLQLFSCNQVLLASSTRVSRFFPYIIPGAGYGLFIFLLGSVLDMLATCPSYLRLSLIFGFPLFVFNLSLFGFSYCVCLIFSPLVVRVWSFWMFVSNSRVCKEDFVLRGGLPLGRRD